jgi:hypothetical protein
MAKLKTDATIAELRKHFGKSAAFFELNGQKIMRSWPDHTSRKWLAHLNGTLKQYNDAQKEAKLILEDPAIKAEYKAKCRPGETPFKLLVHELYYKTKDDGNS